MRVCVLSSLCLQVCAHAYGCMCCCVRKGGDAEGRAGWCIADRVDLEVSAGGLVVTWSGYGGAALTVLRSYCHGSIFHFNEVQ